jgi:hypothetical protein
MWADYTRSQAVSIDQLDYLTDFCQGLGIAAGPSNAVLR